MVKRLLLRVSTLPPTALPPSPVQVAEFLKLWRVPECGLRTLPLLHRLKTLAGIVEPRNPGRELNNRPGAWVD